jgi:hypothetical protein
MVGSSATDDGGTGGAFVDGTPNPSAGAQANGPPPFTPVIVVPGAKDVPGWCDANGNCKVPVNHDPEEGWEWTDPTQTAFALAPGLCQKMRALAGHLEITSACGEKTPDRPVCATSGVNPTPVGDASITDTSKCPPQSLSCGGACVQVMTDPSNCGGCGHVCPAGNFCQNGGCMVDPAMDASTCTPDGVPCGSGIQCCSGSCFAGKCGPAPTDSGTCGPPPLMQCGPTCTNVMSDPTNCGTCGHFCPSGSCNAGICSGGPDAGPDTSCIPVTCAQLGFNCGPAGDGCGGVLDCGSCPAPQLCGGGGKPPGVCG